MPKTRTSKPRRLDRHHVARSARHASARLRPYQNLDGLKKRLATLEEREPDYAMLVASEAITLGIETLVRLIDSKKLSNGSINDMAEGALCVPFRRFARELCACCDRHYRRDAIAAVWDVGEQCARKISDLAKIDRGLSDEGLNSLRSVGSHRLFMPTFRPRRGGFVEHFDRVAEAAGLSNAIGINTDAKGGYWPEAFLTGLLMELVQRVEVTRAWVNQQHAIFSFHRLCGTTGKSRQENFAQWFADKYPEADRNLLRLENLDPLDKNSRDQWWKVALKPMLERPELLDSIRDTSFYKQLSGAPPYAKDYQIVNKLRQRCKRVLYSKSFVRDLWYKPGPKAS